MRITVIGAGAIGGITAAYLAKAGRDVRLVEVNPEVVEKINRDGLELTSNATKFNVRIPISRSVADFTWGPDDFIILSVKSQHSKQVIDQVADAVGSKIPICCFQNGVQNEVWASQRFKYVYGAKVVGGGKHLEPGRVFHLNTGSTTGTAVGVYPSGPPDDKLKALVQEFKGTGLNVYSVDDVMAHKYTKLIMNTVNAICAITGSTAAEALNLPEVRKLVDDCMLESERVLDAAGIKYDKSQIFLKPPDVSLIPRDLPEEMQHLASTHQDLILRRSNTEVDYLSGEFVTLGKKYGVPTPINELMVKLVHEMTERGEAPGKYSASDIRKML